MASLSLAYSQAELFSQPAPHAFDKIKYMPAVSGVCPSLLEKQNIFIIIMYFKVLKTCHNSTKRSMEIPLKQNN